MKCDICNKPILYKKDLFAGPLNRSANFYIGALLGRNIRTYHEDCYKKLPPYQKMAKNILPMSGIWGKIYVFILPILFVITLLIAFISGIVLSVKAFIIFPALLVVLLFFEVLLIKLQQKIKREYSNKLK